MFNVFDEGKKEDVEDNWDKKSFVKFSKVVKKIVDKVVKYGYVLVIIYVGF